MPFIERWKGSNKNILKTSDAMHLLSICWVPPSSPAYSPLLLFSKTTQYGISHGHFLLAVLVLSPHSFLCIPSLLKARQYEELKSPWLSVSTAQQQFEHWWNVIFNLNQHHPSYQEATKKKINPILVKTWMLTQFWGLLHKDMDLLSQSR